MKVVTKSANIRAIPLLESFVWKWDNLNAKETPKCRFVARGDLQAMKGDTFSPVASNLSFRLLLFLASTWKTTIFQLNVPNVFLYGTLPEPIYLQLPARHPDAKLHNKVWTTTRSIYGLCEAPRH